MILTLKVDYMKLLHFKGIHIVSKWFLRIFTFDTALAITLFPFVIYRTKYIRNHQDTRNHETIHVMQQMECGLVGVFSYLLIGFLSGYWFVSLPVLFLFYTLYLFFYLINLFRYKRRINAYENIPFEREAYLNSNRYSYIGLRKPFSWILYIKGL